MKTTPYRRHQLYVEAWARIAEWEKMGLPTLHARTRIEWQGDVTTHSHGHLDIDTVNKLSWKEFIHDNSFFGRYGSSDNYEQSAKYSGPLTWEEIDAIPDITLEK